MLNLDECLVKYKFIPEISYDTVTFFDSGDKWEVNEELHSIRFLYDKTLLKRCVVYIIFHLKLTAILVTNGDKTYHVLQKLQTKTDFSKHLQ